MMVSRRLHCFRRGISSAADKFVEFAAEQNHLGAVFENPVQGIGCRIGNNDVIAGIDKRIGHLLPAIHVLYCDQ